ncbi:MAG: serine hydrolase domain-containing protein [Parasphingopyxis sp.]|uniref:serine hydrolase domain-containing protein n=1 Tax=Parasphingopyxis sp. TaxID=1920299 RepID=UPI003FA073FA
MGAKRALRTAAGLFGLAAVLFPAAVTAQSDADPVLEQRLGSFLAGGYEPLTTPVGWYAPTEQVRGGDYPDIRQLVESDAFDADAIAAVAAHAGRIGSSALLISHRGQLVHESYWQDSGRDTYFNPQSMSKTVAAMLIGVAIAEGHIASVDDPVGRYIAEWADDPRGAITIRHLLHMSGGLAQLSGDYGYAVVPENPSVAQFFGSDFVGPILGLAQVDPPGARWDYNNNETNLLGVVVARATGMRYADFLSDTLWRPLDLADASLYLDREGGTPMMSCCILSRPIDWLRIGELVANRGAFGGTQLVPADWIDAMLAPAPTRSNYGYLTWLGDQRVGGEPDPRPGLIPWQSEPFAADDLIFLHGHGGQRTWIVASRELVIVRAGRSWPTEWDEAAIPNAVIRALDEGDAQ